MASVKDGDLASPMPLREFLAQLGVVMQLPSRQAETAAAPSTESAPTRARPRTRLALPVLAVLAVSVFSLSRLAPPPLVQLPSEILGTWTTRDGRHAGTRLVLSKSTVQMLQGERPVAEPYRIQSAEVRRRPDSIAVVLLHETDGGATKLAAAWSREGGRERLTLKHPAGVTWFRLQDTLAAPAARTANQGAVRPRRGSTPGVPAGPGEKPWEH
jgi:hypothetical protein